MFLIIFCWWIFILFCRIRCILNFLILIILITSNRWIGLVILWWGIILFLWLLIIYFIICCLIWLCGFLNIFLYVIFLTWIWFIRLFIWRIFCACISFKSRINYLLLMCYYSWLLLLRFLFIFIIKKRSIWIHKIVNIVYLLIVVTIS